MLPLIAAFGFVLGIMGLFSLAREPRKGISKALWIPVSWLLIAGSRNPDEWLHLSAPTDQSQRYLEGDPLDRVVLFTLIVLGLAVLFKRRRQVGAVLRASMPILLYFTYCAASSLWSDYPDVAAKRWVRGFGDLVMVLVILTDEDWLAALKRVVTRVGFVLLPLSVLLIRYFPSLGRGYSKGGAPTWTGVADDKNALGMICLIFGLGIIWSFVEVYRRRDEERRNKRLFAYGVVILMTLYLLWETNSMTAMSCFVLAGCLMLATLRWPLARKPGVASFLAVATVAISAFVLFGGAGSVLQLLGRNPTLTGRTEVWQALLPFAQNPMFGSGYESFWLGDRLVEIGRAVSSYGIQEAHNGYLEIYLNLGWVGLALLGLVTVTGFRKVIGALRQNPSAASLMLAYFVLALIYNFTEAAFKMMNPVWIFFLLSMMAVPLMAVAESPATLDPYPAYSFAAGKPQLSSAIGAPRKSHLKTFDAAAKHYGHMRKEHVN